MKKQLLTLSLACLIMLTGCAKQPRPAEPRSPAEPPFLEDNLLEGDDSVGVLSEWRTNSAERETFDYGYTSEESRSARQSRGQGGQQYGGKVDPKTAGMLVRLAKTTLGTPYVFGGSSRNGFDCSGLVRWTYSHFGINLPRSAAEQAQMGRPIRNQNALQAGDLVTFRHPRRGYHIGIYVGDGKFIHSPQRNKNVTIVSLNDDYFRRIYTGARRLDTDDISNNRIEEVEDLVNAYKEDVGRRKRLAAERKNGRNGNQQVASRSRNGSSSSRSADVRAERKKNRREEAENPREQRRYSADSRDARRNGSVNRVSAEQSRKEARSNKEKRRQEQNLDRQQRSRQQDKDKAQRQRDRQQDSKERAQRQRDRQKDSARENNTRAQRDNARRQEARAEAQRDKQDQRKKQQDAARQQNTSRKAEASKDRGQQRLSVDVRRSSDKRDDKKPAASSQNSRKDKRDDKKRDDKKRDDKKRDAKK